MRDISYTKEQMKALRARLLATEEHRDEAAAQWCAARGLKAASGDPLPNLISADVEAEIQENIDAFRERVSAYAYARAMESSPRDISSITEYGMTCPLSRAVRVY